MRIKNVLVFPGGSEIGLEINAALREAKDIRLFSAGSGVSNHAPYVFEHHFEVPSINTPGWIDALNEVIVKNNIDYVYPAYDDIIVSLAENQEQIKASVVTPSVEACQLTRSKLLTYQAFDGILPVPRVYATPEDIDAWPVFLKPERGQGAQGTHLVKTGEDLDFYLKNDPSLMILEYLPGKEYTIDCFSPHGKAPIFVSGRERIRTRSGISMSSTVVKNPIWQEYARLINEKLGMRGAWFYQVKESASGTMVLMEIAPRISGTMATHRVLGVNFPLLSIYDLEGLNVNIETNSYHITIDRALTNRYSTDLEYSRAYIDFDDTIYLNGKVSIPMVSLLYQMKDEGKELILITKSATDIQQMLDRCHLSSTLFDRIIHLKKEDIKHLHIEPEGSIFIDDSFSERKAVADQWGIPTFDNSMIEVLTNHKA